MPITGVVPSGSKRSGAGSTNWLEPAVRLGPTGWNRFPIGHIAPKWGKNSVSKSHIGQEIENFLRPAGEKCS